MPRTVKVAVAGSGLAGLTASWLLTRPMKNQDVKFEVHIFEKAGEIGMDASSISLTDPKSKEQWRIDVPMRSFQGGYYPQLISMYKSLGVKIRQADFSYSFSQFTPSTPSSRRKVTTNFIYNGSSGRAGFGKPSSLANQPKDSILVQMWSWTVFVLMTIETLLCFLVSVCHAAPFLRAPGIEDKSFGQWAEEVTPRGFLARLIGLDVAWKCYVCNIMIPLWSAMCTATIDDILNYPAVEFLDVIWLTIGTRHYRLANGVRDVVTQLSKDLKNIHLSSPITSISLDPKAPHLASITYTKPSGEQQTLHGFDHVIFATEAKTAASVLDGWASKIIESPKSQTKSLKQTLLQQAEALGKFRYRTNVVVNHTDDTLLPDDPRDHRQLNLIYYHGHELKDSEQHPERDSSVCVSSSFAMATHALPRPEGYPAHLPAVYQSTNLYIPPKKGTILSVTRMERAVSTVEAWKASQGFCQENGRRWWECPAVARTKLGPLQGAGRLSGGRNPGIWICGSYAFPGIPLLEGCVVSARNVVIQGILQCEGAELKEEPWVA